MSEGVPLVLASNARGKGGRRVEPPAPPKCKHHNARRWTVKWGTTDVVRWEFKACTRCFKRWRSRVLHMNVQAWLVTAKPEGR